MKKKVLIIGNNPIAECLTSQYELQGIEVEHINKTTANSTNINNYYEICILTSIGDENNDHEAVALLGELATEYDVDQHGGKRLICHLLVQSDIVLRMLQTTDFSEIIRKKIDVYPFSMDEVWSRSIVLDYEPITIQSNKHVHLVIFGMGEMAERVAIQAALSAHYPNYVINHSLRTRITIIDSHTTKLAEEFIKRYQPLFDNSYYRIINLNGECEFLQSAITKFHKPMYEGEREDFVDVEWEFVEAETWNVDVKEKLQLWTKDERQLMTVVMADKNGNKNISEALLLPQELYRQNVPVYIYSQQELILPYSHNVHGFGMINSGYDVTLPLVRMAKNVNYIYDRCYEDNDVNWNGQLRYTVEIDERERDRSWNKLSNVKRMSSIYNAMTIPTKMRSIGLEKNEWDKFFDISQQDIDVLAQVEHNRWCVEELILGFRPCTDNEQQQIESDIRLKKEFKKKKVHYDLRSYKDLRLDETGKSVKIYDLCLCSCLPLIAKAFIDEEGGEV